MHTLYGTRGSGSAAIDAALQWAGVPYAQVDAASWQPGQGLDELGRINPLRQIPTLVLSDGSVLTESAAILIHLGLTQPASGLLPLDAAQRAQAIRGLVFVAANCYAAISIIDFPERWCSDAEDDAVAKLRIQQGSRHRLHLHWDLFASQFMPLAAGQHFLNGASPGALDLLAAVVSRWSGARKHLQVSQPEFHALLLRVDAHPRLVAVFEHHWPTQGT
jgi:GST-like protein